MQHENNKNTLYKYFILIRKYLNNFKKSIDKDEVNKRVNRSTVTRMRGIPVSDLTQYTIHVCLHTLSGSQLKHVAVRKNKKKKKKKTFIRCQNQKLSCDASLEVVIFHLPHLY